MSFPGVCSGSLERSILRRPFFFRCFWGELDMEVNHFRTMVWLDGYLGGPVHLPIGSVFLEIYIVLEI